MSVIKPKISESEYHKDMVVSKSKLLLIRDEFHFLNQLINSYVFEPNTPNLFERLQDYKTKLDQLHTKYDHMFGLLTDHDNELDGLMECDTIVCETAYDEKHIMIMELLDDFVDTFQELKSSIFKYCGSILKKHKK